MEMSNILKKISTIFSILFSSPWTIIPTVILIIFLYELFFQLKREDMKLKYFFCVGVGSCLLFSLVTSFSAVITGFDEIINGVLTEYYFPSMSVYMGIIFISYIVVTISMLKNNLPVYIKKTNVIMFAIIEILFFEFLYLIGKSHIPLSDINQIHSNQQILIILETTTLITIIWVMVGIGFLVVKHFLPEFEKKKEMNNFPQVSVSQFKGIPIFPQETLNSRPKLSVKKEDVDKLTKLYEEEQKLVEEQLTYMLLLQEKKYEKLSNELHKLSQFSRKKSELVKQLNAYDILLHNEKITMEEEIELLFYIKKKEQEKIKKEIALLQQKLFEKNEDN